MSIVKNNKSFNHRKLKSKSNFNLKQRYNLNEYINEIYNWKVMNESMKTIVDVEIDKNWENFS